MLRAAFGWAAALAALPAPDAAAVRSMMTPEGVGAGPWIAVYAICALALILAPRAGLAAWVGARLRTRSSWLNAASFEMSRAVAEQVYRLPFVYDVRPVGRDSCQCQARLESRSET